VPESRGGKSAQKLKLAGKRARHFVFMVKVFLPRALKGAGPHSAFLSGEG